ncbi:MAG: ASCH domain-containing protein [Patescibacteria group bacterium]
MARVVKQLPFDGGYLYDVLTGAKRITIRRYRQGKHDFNAGEVIYGDFKGELKILIRITAKVDLKPFGSLTKAEAREDGFNDANDAFNDLRKYYPQLKKTEMAAVIRFEVAKIDGVPAVSLSGERE